MNSKTFVSLFAAVAVILFTAQACGGSSSNDNAPTPTAIPLPSGAQGPGGGGFGGAGAGPFGDVANPDAELAAFFGMSVAELEGELSADDATLGQIADATGRSREDLAAFLIERAQTAFAERQADGAGNFPGGDQAFLTDQLPSIIEAIIDGEELGGRNLPDGFPGGTPGGGRGFGGFLGLGDSNEELADLLGLAVEELDELLADEETTLADVAADGGLSREELFNFLLAQAESNIEQAVSDGTIGQENADQFLDGLADTIDAFIDGTGLGRRPFGGATAPRSEGD